MPGLAFRASVKGATRGSIHGSIPRRGRKDLNTAYFRGLGVYPKGLNKESVREPTRFSGGNGGFGLRAFRVRFQASRGCGAVAWPGFRATAGRGLLGLGVYCKAYRPLNPKP